MEMDTNHGHQGVSQESALAGFNKGYLIIVTTPDGTTPDGMRVCTQRLPNGTVRSAIIRDTKSLSPDQFRDALAQREGGMVGLIKEVLGIIGVQPEIVPGSVVLRNLMHGASAEEALSVFSFPEK